MIISIYQLKPQYEEFYRSSFDSIVNYTGEKPSQKMYRKIYTGEVNDNDGIDDIFAVLQREMPDDFVGHDFGVSDVVGIESNGTKLKKDNYYFCDNIGWQKLNWEQKESFNSDRQVIREADDFDTNTSRPNNLFFSANQLFNIQEGMRPNEQGNHFWLSESDAKKSMKDLGHRYVYSIYSEDLASPLKIEQDIILWDARNLADLFICKINDIPYDIWGDGEDFIYPNQIHINNLGQKDLSKLYRIKDFDEIFDFIRSKGYGHIQYYNTQEYGDIAVILNHDSNFDYNSLERLQ